MDKTDQIFDKLEDICSAEELPRNIRLGLEHLSDLLVNTGNSIETQKHKMTELIEIMIMDQNLDMLLKTDLLSLLSLVESLGLNDS